MFKGLLVSLMTLFFTLVFVSSSQALVVQNKTDTTFNITSSDYVELCNGAAICPDKQKHCIKVCANEKIVIKGKKGNYKVTRYMLNGKKEKINFKCCVSCVN